MKNISLIGLTIFSLLGSVAVQAEDSNQNTEQERLKRCRQTQQYQQKVDQQSSIFKHCMNSVRSIDNAESQLNTLEEKAKRTIDEVGSTVEGYVEKMGAVGGQVANMELVEKAVEAQTELADAFAFHRGKIVEHAKRLGKEAKEISRRYPVQIQRIADKALPLKTIKESGKRIEDASRWASQLEQRELMARGTAERYKQFVESSKERALNLGIDPGSILEGRVTPAPRNSDDKAFDVEAEMGEAEGNLVYSTPVIPPNTNMDYSTRVIRPDSRFQYK